MKPFVPLFLSGALLLSATGCSGETKTSPTPTPDASQTETLILLSDDGILVGGEAVSTDPSEAIHTGTPIVYYQDGTDETYGEGNEDEMHSAEEAAAHTVLTITQPGTYRLSGTLSKGQIAVDLGEEAEDDPNAVVTLILDNADVTCTVAPALIFYNVYECGSTDTETATGEVDTSAAGANVILKAGSENHFTGSHVARIYKEGTTKKLHKYDGAFYSKMSMNIWGDEDDNTGTLYIVADNEGLDSELHLSLYGGTIDIQSQDDGINTNEDGVSVTTIYDGNLTIHAGLGAEGDGIDSNGFLTMYGGTVTTYSNPRTPDGGIDADCDIALYGGTLSAFGTRNEAVASTSTIPYMELSFRETPQEGSTISLRDEKGGEVWSTVAEHAYSSITLTCPELALDTTYSLYVDDVLQCWTTASIGGFPGGGQPPEGFEPPEDFDPSKMPEGFEPPEGFDPGQRPDRPDGQPEDFDPNQMPEGGEQPEGNGPRPDDFMMNSADEGDPSTDFTLSQEQHSFGGIRAAEEEA